MNRWNDTSLSLSEQAFISDAIKQLRSEISAGRRSGKTIELLSGKEIARSNDEYWYAFSADVEIGIVPDTPVAIIREEERIGVGVIVACEEDTIFIATDTDLGKYLNRLDIKPDWTALLEQLIGRMSDMKASGISTIVSELISAPKRLDSAEVHSINLGSATAATEALNNPVTFVWGPPGTGKTQTLSEIALTAMQAGMRVLVLSHSNIAVDEAILRISRQGTETLKPGEVLRYGYPRNKEILEHPTLSAYNFALSTKPELFKHKQELLSRRAGLKRLSEERMKLDRTLDQIRKQIRDVEAYKVQQARIVGTTAAKAAMDRVIYQAAFDVVIFDESSMAYIPQIVFAAGLARKSFVCIGDFAQLPPIVQAKNVPLLERDIFSYTGIDTVLDYGTLTEPLCILDKQFRMKREIADFVSHRMYGSILATDNEADKKAATVTQCTPFNGKAIAIADLTGTVPVCITTKNKSRVNVLSALISAAIALRAANNGTVGIITPFREQALLMRAIVKDAAVDHPQAESIKCATVHQFQGSEKDIVLFDVTQCYRDARLAPLLGKTADRYADRLMNVAMTRARGKFILIGHLDYLRRKLKKSLLLRQLIDAADSVYPVEETYKEICAQSPEASFRWLSPSEAEKQFATDLRSSEHTVLMDLPSPLNVADDVNSLARLLRSLRSNHEVRIRAEDCSTVPPAMRVLCDESANALNPVTVIDEEVVWFGKPLSASSFVVDDKKEPVRLRPISRLVGAYTARCLTRLLGLGNVRPADTNLSMKSTHGEDVAESKSFKNYVERTKVCPECGRPLTLRIPRKRGGKPFLGCTGYSASGSNCCNHVEPLHVADVNAYLWGEGPYPMECPKCRKVLEARSGRYGVYVSCGQHTFGIKDV